MLDIVVPATEEAGTGCHRPTTSEEGLLVASRACHSITDLRSIKRRVLPSSRRFNLGVSFPERVIGNLPLLETVLINSILLYHNGGPAVPNMAVTFKKFRQIRGFPD